MELHSGIRTRQGGLSFFGFLFVIVIIALVAILGMKVVPTVVEYAAIKKAIQTAKASGTTPREIQGSFEKQRDTAYIESVTSKDLEIFKSDDGLDVNIAYQKKIELFGPVSLTIDYEATTVKGQKRTAAQ
jgi:hypothetical protein